MLEDRYGLTLSTKSAEARDAYVDGVDRMLAANEGAPEALDRAIEFDPAFALAHAARARAFQLAGAVPHAQAAAASAVERAGACTDRERRHVEIFSLLVNGRGQDALALLREHLVHQPRDALALSPACGVFGLIGFSGRAGREPEQLELLAPLESHYGDDWWFLTSYAFALIELGEWQRGRELVDRALEQHPRSAHTAHVRAHALYEAGEDSTSTAFLESWLPEYSPDAPLHCHLWWHLALLRLMAGDFDGMRQVFDERCAPAVSKSPAINVASDGASMLWRAELAGDARDAGRWRAVRTFIDEKFAKPMVFVDAHAALAAAVDTPDSLGEVIETLEQMGSAGALPAGTVPAELGRAFGDFEAGRWGDVIERLERLDGEVVRIGGSRAQRDLIANTLLAAYVKDGRAERARALIAGREDRQPSVPVAGLDPGA